MDRFVRDCALALIAVLLTIAISGAAKADRIYHIPDDCLGSWKYCKTFKLRHFTDYGPYFTDDSRFLPEALPPDLDDPFPNRIQPLSPSAGEPLESLKQ
ncbi:MAG: hypothetical protein ACREDW_06770 [Aestuariivirgaceae bacterium]